MEEQQRQANEYGAPRDRYDAFRNQLLRKRDFHASQYQRAIDELKILEIIDPDKNCDKAEFGAVVISSMHKLFISVGLGKIKVGEEEFFAISPKVPIFNAVDGKAKGESFSINGRQFELLEVY